MRDNITDFNKFKEDKKRREEDKYNLDLLMNVLVKNEKDMSDGEKFIYAQIKLVSSFIIKEKYTMGIIEFRGVLYLINATPYGTFEYLGKLDDVISKYMEWNE
jgi:hypothetical protein